MLRNVLWLAHYNAILDTNLAFFVFAGYRHFVLDGDHFGQMVLVESAVYRSHVFGESIVERGDKLVMLAVRVEARSRHEVLKQPCNIPLMF